MEEVPKVPLSFGKKPIPVIGFGTAYYPVNLSKETVKESILKAIMAGYTHFDTASIYGVSEEALGKAIGDALRLGLITSRDQLFITSKVWTSDAYPDSVVPALKKTLQKLGLEYLDLYLIHWPASAKRGTHIFPFKKGETYPMDFPSVWEAMEECQNLGFTKSIGVCNFSTKKLEKILATAKIPPAVNQVEMNPCWQQKKLREYCTTKNIHVTAYSPLGAKGTIWGTNRVMDCELLKEIARAKGKSLAQVCLRWAYEQGVSVLVKSFNKGRMKENLDIFGWNLSTEEMEKIRQIPQEKGCLALELVTDEGPYDSLKDLWDDDFE